MKILSSFLVIMPFLVTLSIVLYFHRPNLIDTNIRVYSDSSKTNTYGGGKDVIFLPIERGHIVQNVNITQNVLGSRKEDAISQAIEISGLIAPGTDKKSCLSRFESSLYRRSLPRKPSPYLVSKLRSYEERHRRCGPNTKPYKRAVRKLKSGGNLNAIGPDDCNYIVYLSSHGLGNRILTSTASFLYALLTDRVFLVHFGNDVPEDLFCEPFHDASWSLPNKFPLAGEFSKVGKGHPHTFGNMLDNKKISIDAPITNKPVAPYLYVHVLHDYTTSDSLFFCDDLHKQVENVPWLLVSANNYFVPEFFLMPSFEKELSMLFPEKETVFHHLGRYLFNPSNSVWGMVKRYHQANLARSDEIIGIQVRTFDKDPGPFPHVMGQILACVKKGNLLPQVVEEKDISNNTNNNSTPKHKAVLITSLSSGYLEKLKEMYWRKPNQNGDFIEIFQPSHEEHQQTEKHSHNSKAWTEIYLLSLSDVLVTSGRSTFGYVAQGLGGLRPWILPQVWDQIVPDPPCVLTETVEPCFLAGPVHGCDAKKTDPGFLVPHVKHCEDIPWGLKVF